MSKLRFLVLLVAAVMCLVQPAKGQEPAKYTLKGDIGSVLKQFDEGSVIESVALRVYPKMQIISNGGSAISYYGVFDGVPKFAQLVVDLTVPGGSGSAQVPFVLEAGTLVFDGGIAPSGGKLNDALRALWKELAAMKEADIPAAIKKFVMNEENAPASVILLNVVASALDPEITLSIIAQAPQQVRSHREVRPLITRLEAEAFRVRNMKSTDKGQKFKDFTVYYNGKEQNLSDYVGKGKYVLVDFWASWCGPCRAEIPNIINVYKKYAGADFDVVGVAINDKPQNTVAAIESMGMTYPQIIGAGPEIGAIYGINSIPHVILFAPDGTVVARGLRGEQIEEAVKEVLKK